jgi:hypothetical protein
VIVSWALYSSRWVDGSIGIVMMETGATEAGSIGDKGAGVGLDLQIRGQCFSNPLF